MAISHLHSSSDVRHCHIWHSKYWATVSIWIKQLLGVVTDSAGAGSKLKLPSKKVYPESWMENQGERFQSVLGLG